MLGMADALLRIKYLSRWGYRCDKIDNIDNMEDEHFLVFLAFFRIFLQKFVKIRTFYLPKDTGKQTSGNDTGAFTDCRGDSKGLDFSGF